MSDWTQEQRHAAIQEVERRCVLDNQRNNLAAIYDAIAIELCCERDRARRERDRSVEVLKMWERWERDREGDYSEIVNQSKVVIAALEAE